MSAHTDLWQDVLKVALLGTERHAFTLAHTDTRLDDVLARLDDSEREGALLSAAAAVSLYQRAGWLPARDSQPLPQACEPDDQPECNRRTAQHLSLMLDGQHGAVLPEWLSSTDCTDC